MERATIMARPPGISAPKAVESKVAEATVQRLDPPESDVDARPDPTRADGRDPNYTYEWKYHWKVLELVRSTREGNEEIGYKKRRGWEVVRDSDIELGRPLEQFQAASLDSAVRQGNWVLMRIRNEDFAIITWAQDENKRVRNESLMQGEEQHFGGAKGPHMKVGIEYET
jgi:hypothetical protein